VSERSFINVPMTPDLKKRVQKAADKYGLTAAAYMRDAAAFKLEANDDWSIPGPRKGANA
jgi:hypothetical protein